MPGEATTFVEKQCQCVKDNVQAARTQVTDLPNLSESVDVVVAFSLNGLRITASTAPHWHASHRCQAHRLRRSCEASGDSEVQTVKAQSENIAGFPSTNYSLLFS